MSEFVPLGKWRHMSASVIGTSHLARQLPCQDAHRVLALPQGGLIAAVADGAGSASHAEHGAGCAVDAATRLLAVRLETEGLESAADCRLLLTDAFREARRHLEEQAPVIGVELRELASTLLIAIVTPRWLAVAQVGDGSIVYRDAQDELHVLSRPVNQEFVNETTFLTSSRYLEDISCQTIAGETVDGLALMSDGVQFLALSYADNSAYVPFFKPLFAYLDQAQTPSLDYPADGSPLPPREGHSPASHDERQAELVALLQSKAVCERTDDDKTLVLAVNRDARSSS